MEMKSLTTRENLLNTFTEDELDEFCEYLNDLRESGIVNMFGSPVLLQEEFVVSKKASYDIFSYWASTFQNYLKNDA